MSFNAADHKSVVEIHGSTTVKSNELAPVNGRMTPFSVNGLT